MTLQQLEYVVALDTHRHFVTAAAYCYVTQPTLTMQLKKLEEELGLQLFDRSRQPLIPTQAGELVVRKAREILREVEEMKALVRHEQESLVGEFRIGVIPTLGPYLMPRFLGDFVQQHPEARLVIHELQSTSIIEGLQKNTLDLGILVTPLDERDLREVPVFFEPFLAYVSEEHALYQKSILHPSDIQEDEVWILNQGHCFRNQVLNLCHPERRPRLTTGFSYESGSIETLKRMVESQTGYTLVPELSVWSQRDHPMVKRFAPPEPVREVSLVVHQRFSKEMLLSTLRDSILRTIPDSFARKEQHIRIKWR